MFEMNHILSIFSMFTSIIAFSLGLVTFVFTKSSKTLIPLGLLMIFSSIYSFGYAYEILSGDLTWVNFWLKIEYIGLAYISPCILWLTLKYTNNTKYLKPWFYILIFSIGTFILLSVLTNDGHHLYYTAMKISHSGPFPIVELEKGPIYHIQTFWMFFVTSISLFLYLKYYFKSNSNNKNQTLLMMFGSGNIICIFALYIFKITPPNLDIGPFSIAINAFIFTFGIFKFGLLKISPLARDKIFENIRDVVIVTDEKYHIIDFNLAGQSLISHFQGNTIFEKIPNISKSNDSNPIKILDHLYEVMSAPITKYNKIIGFMWVLRKVTFQHKLMEQLKYYAERDSLTGILNRRKWIEIARQKCEEGRNTKSTLGITMIDIDHFKSINDTYGHETGDIVLNMVTKKINEYLDNKDYFGRLGGEEFAIIFTEKNYALIEKRTIEIVEGIANITYDLNKNIHVTISAGTVIYENGLIPELDECTRNADIALYQSKFTGKNKVSLYNDDHKKVKAFID